MEKKIVSAEDLRAITAEVIEKEKADSVAIAMNWLETVFVPKATEKAKAKRTKLIVAFPEDADVNTLHSVLGKLGYKRIQTYHDSFDSCMKLSCDWKKEI